ncbi:MAG: ABC-F family ATP-binding cassette domain-containing protein [Anaerovoracaceae bacterium]
MIILSAKELSKVYGTDVILENISFHINQGDRIGIIGANGAGKTTLLKILTGEITHDSGDFFLSADTSIGYLKQNDNFRSEKTLLQEVEGIFSGLESMESEMLELSGTISEKASNGETGAKVDKLLAKYDQMQEDYRNQGGYSYKSEINGILNSMAFDESFYEKKIETLSGGERTRLALACLLLKKPDLLFLDEPTNHLDIGTLKWLEQYLKSYTGTIVLVSHDRYFLDQMVNRVFEVENHKLHTYEGNYTDFAKQKRMRRESEMRKYQQQQKEIHRQEDIIRKFKERGTEKLAKRAQSREKRLDGLEVTARPEAVKGKMKLAFKQKFKSGNDVLFGENLSKSFGYGQNERKLFSHVDLDIKRGEKICIVGSNGVGKTTLLKIFMGEIDPNCGYLKVGHNVEFGYYDQGQQLLNGENTLFEELKDAYRLYTDTEMRSILGRFLFSNDTVFLPINALSGGEKARLSLVKLMLSGANVLILDEPTNHLDIESKEVFEDALADFPGTVIVVSHDRYFLNKIPDRIFELGQSGISTFLGTYNYYVEKKQEIESGKKYLNQMAGKEEKQENATVNQQRQKKKQEEARIRKNQRLREKAEAEISSLEEKVSTIEAEMCLEENLVDHVKLSKINDQLAETKEALSVKYEQWLELQE